MKDIEKIESYLRGELSGDELERVKNRIENDDAWKAEFESMGKTYTLLRSAEVASGPADAYFNNLLPRLRARMERSSMKRRLLFSRIVPATAVVVAIMVFVVWRNLPQTTPGDAAWLEELGNPVGNLVDAIDSDSVVQTTLTSLEALETGGGDDWAMEMQLFEENSMYAGDIVDSDLSVSLSADPLDESDLQSVLAGLSDQEFEVLVAVLDEFETR